MFNHKIATIGSHSALQILKGAKDEGFSTIVICIKNREKLYKLFDVADEIIIINDYKEFPKIQNKLKKEKAIIIPHASFIAYLGLKTIEKLKIPYYGNKKILHWESDRNKEKKWLAKSKLNLPKIFTKAEKIDRLVIVKLHGADGGKGYFLAKDKDDFIKKTKSQPKQNYFIQEYIIGVPIYIHYFYSPITNQVEIMGFDKRYETNVDSLGRINSYDQLDLPKKMIDPSYVVIGNFPMVVRESLLPKILEMGQNVVKASQKIAPPGLFGPFCLETILTSESKFYTFEISARIVAGTNPYINGSPYTWIKYNEPMSTGRRIARDIKQAIEQNKLEKILY